MLKWWPESGSFDFKTSIIKILQQQNAKHIFFLLKIKIRTIRFWEETCDITGVFPNGSYKMKIHTGSWIPGFPLWYPPCSFVLVSRCCCSAPQVALPSVFCSLSGIWWFSSCPPSCLLMSTSERLMEQAYHTPFDLLPACPFIPSNQAGWGFTNKIFSKYLGWTPDILVAWILWLWVSFKISCTLEQKPECHKVTQWECKNLPAQIFLYPSLT